MKFTIFTSLIIAAPAISALHLPHKNPPPAARSAPATPAEDPANSPISREEFDPLYEIVNEFVQADDYVGLSALNFLTGDALEDFESGGDQPEATDAPAVAKRKESRPPSLQFEKLVAFLGQR